MIQRQPAPLRDVAALRQQVARWRAAGESVALVPTMGALHAGHLSLVELAREHARRCVVSIFVNPTQFGPSEDFDAYPRDETGDLAKLATVAADAVFLPSAGEMYPRGFNTKVAVGGVSEGLCGGARPGHFDGVATVVTKLLLQCLPDVAIFGEKDYQQLMLIRRLVADLDIPVHILGAPIRREADGLAMSSRNAYLSPAERATAPRLHATLLQAGERLLHGEPFAEVQVDASRALAENGFRPEYLELRAAADLEPLQRVGDAPARLLVAARLGRTRLIDNVRIDKTAGIG
jgi:pantoate--beta-alanine ligase